MTKRVINELLIPAVEPVRICLAMDPMSQQLGHVIEKDGRQLVNLYRSNRLELWEIGEIGEDGIAKIELLTSIPVAAPQPSKTDTGEK